jgi:Ca2+-binding RTX toxin-like protein
MNRFDFGSQVDMSALDLSVYFGGSTSSASDSEVDLTGGGGETTVILGTFDALGETGTVTDVVLRDASTSVVLSASNLNIDLSQLLNDGADGVALAQDLFGGNDLIHGSDQDDALLGGDGKDIIVAGDGADVINGGAGYDRLTGGLGADLFVFQDSGKDQIRDFDAASVDHDTIEVDAQGVDGVDKLTFHDNGHGDAVVKWLDNDVVERLIVRGVDSATLQSHAEDFVFGPQVQIVNLHGHDFTL